jgi:hypothetical protein
MRFLSKFVFVMVAVLYKTALCASVVTPFGGMTTDSSYLAGNQCEPCYMDTECCDNYSEFYVGAIGYRAHRRVNDSVVGLDDFFGSEDGHRRNTGTLWGAVVGYTYRNPCNFYFNAEFDYGTGHIKGKDCQGSFPKGHVNEYFTTLKAGYNFQCNCLTLTPYGGVGYLYERHNLSHGSRFNYNNWFGIIGGRIDWQYNDCLTIGLDAEGFIPFNTYVHLNKFCKNVDLKDRLGYQIELPIRYNISSCYCENIFVTLAPFYRYMQSGNSKFFTCGAETFRAPGLKANDFGAKLYIGRTF